MSARRPTFVPDRTPEDLDGDPFRVRPVAERIVSVIEAVEPPFTISLSGSWGVGKSTLVDEVQRRLPRARIAFIDAWTEDLPQLRRKLAVELGAAIADDRDENSQAKARKETAEALSADMIGIDDPVHMYLREIGRVALLTAEEEVVLGDRARRTARRGARQGDRLAPRVDDPRYRAQDPDRQAACRGFDPRLPLHTPFRAQDDTITARPPFSGTSRCCGIACCNARRHAADVTVTHFPIPERGDPAWVAIRARQAAVRTTACPARSR
jgi:hypothetical protein